MSAQHLLDQVQSVAKIDALAADPAAYADQLAQELGDAETLDALEARDARLRSALGQLDAMIERAARLRLEHALADDVSIGAPTRKVFATTILRYADQVELLEARARDVAARGGAGDPDRIAATIGDLARGVLALRAALRDGVLALIRSLADAAAAVADRHARDRRLDEPVRKRWSAARRDLEAIAGQPDHIMAAAMPERRAAWPEQLDDPDPALEPTFADMIELD